MSKPKAKTLADFRGEYDRNVVIPAKIKAALAQIVQEGAENWEYDAEFGKRAGVSQTDMSLFREQFAEHVVEARAPGRSAKRIWFGDAKVAKKARGE